MAKTDNQTVPFFRRRIVVIAVSVLVMLSAAIAVWFASRALPELPVREVVFVNVSATPFVHLKTEELTRVARAIATAKVNLLRADLNEVKVVVEQVEWVRHADVRRRLPDKIEVSIEEQVPFGVWRAGEKSMLVPASANTDASAGAVVDESVAAASYLINTFGEVFKATLPNDLQMNLPVLGGPLEASQEVIVGFDQFRNQLALIERTPREVQFSVRRAWTIRLDNGMTLELGRNDAKQRLQRFISAYAQIADLQAAGINVDLRYASGLAVRRPFAARTAAGSGSVQKSRVVKKVQKAKRI